jgi:hypothetical protein
MDLLRRDEELTLPPAPSEALTWRQLPPSFVLEGGERDAGIEKGLAALRRRCGVGFLGLFLGHRWVGENTPKGRPRPGVLTSPLTKAAT